MRRRLWISLIILLSASVVLGQTNEDSLAIVSAQWETTTHSKGIKTMHSHFHGLYGGLQDIYIVEVSLNYHKLDVLDHAGRALTSEKAQEAGAQAAINGTYFDMGKTGRSVCFVAKDGMVLDHTSSMESQLCNGAVVLKDDEVEIIPWDTLCEKTWQTEPSSQGKSVMVCGPLLLQQGREEKFLDQSHILHKHPRSGIALSGNKAYFIVIDGRDSKRAIGVTIPEFAHFLRIMKMQSALNLDGGGSSTLWVPAKGILNIPSDKSKERTVSNSIVAK